MWSSEDIPYGGGGSPAPETEERGWRLTGRCAMLLRPIEIEAAKPEVSR